MAPHTKREILSDLHRIAGHERIVAVTSVSVAVKAPPMVRSAAVIDVSIRDGTRNVHAQNDESWILFDGFDGFLRILPQGEAACAILCVCFAMSAPFTNSNGSHCGQF